MVCKGVLAFHLLFATTIRFQNVQDLVERIRADLDNGEYLAIMHVPESHKNKLKSILNTFPGVIAIIAEDGTVHIQKVCVP